MDCCQCLSWGCRAGVEPASRGFLVPLNRWATGIIYKAHFYGVYFSGDKVYQTSAYRLLAAPLFFQGTDLFLTSVCQTAFMVLFDLLPVPLFTRCSCISGISPAHGPLHKRTRLYRRRVVRLFAVCIFIFETRRRPFGHTVVRILIMRPDKVISENSL